MTKWGTSHDPLLMKLVRQIYMQMILLLQNTDRIHGIFTRTYFFQFAPAIIRRLRAKDE